MSRCAVYEIMENGIVVYVGASIDPDARLKQHIAASKCLPSAIVRVVRWFATRRQALAHEALAIKQAKPSKNVFHAAAPRVRLAVAMEVGAARAIWMGSAANEPDAAVLARMPGWTRNMAKHHFGRRH